MLESKKLKFWPQAPLLSWKSAHRPKVSPSSKTRKWWARCPKMSPKTKSEFKFWKPLNIQPKPNTSDQSQKLNWSSKRLQSNLEELIFRGWHGYFVIERSWGQSFSFRDDFECFVGYWTSRTHASYLLLKLTNQSQIMGTKRKNIIKRCGKNRLVQIVFLKL